MNEPADQVPIEKKTQSQRTAQSNARLLKKAVELIVENGVENMTLKEVGEAAGYSRGLASFKFGSKENLIACVIRSVGDELISQLERVIRDRVGLDAICAAIDAHCRFCVAASNQVRAFYILWFESINPGSLSRETVVRIERRREQVVAKWIEQGVEQGLIDPSVDADVVARQFCSSTIGIAWHWLANPTAMDEVKTLHDGLKQVMLTLLSPAKDRRIKKKPHLLLY